MYVIKSVHTHVNKKTGKAVEMVDYFQSGRLFNIMVMNPAEARQFKTKREASKVMRERFGNRKNVTIEPVNK